MGDTLPKFTAAAVQAAPVFLDREGTVDKACELIAEAGDAGADLIVFPETWVPGYPFWHTSPKVFSGDTFADLWKNSVEVPSASTVRLGKTAKDSGAYVVIGINERCTASRGTLYNTLLYFSPAGEVIHRHRKLMPTFTERTIWGLGDGSDLNVVETPLGRLGGLICWEHQMTLAKYALYAQGEQVHCAVWPAYTSQNSHIDFGMRQYAFEGACFVVSACGVVTPGSIPKGLEGDHMQANGGSAIIGPDGGYLAGPVYGSEEIIYAEIDLEAAIREKHSRDVAGHYSRPDVLQLVVHGERKPVATFAGVASAREEPLEAATAEEVVDRLEAVRDYLGSLIERIETDGDSEVNAALVEALASIDMAAAGMWSSK
ncbi:MAG: carbon-nitrogen hydrolase family protein [Chloroflexota bacterium]|nr:carbon-nitrogen hydrolase family protein [Chloroflexota bacterium]